MISMLKVWYILKLKNEFLLCLALFSYFHIYDIKILSLTLSAQHLYSTVHKSNYGSESRLPAVFRFFFVTITRIQQTHVLK